MLQHRFYTEGPFSLRLNGNSVYGILLYHVYVRTYKSIRTSGALAPLFCYGTCEAKSACLRGTVNALREWYTIVPFSHFLMENSVNGVPCSCIFTSLARYRRWGNNPYLLLACTSIKQYGCCVQLRIEPPTYSAPAVTVVWQASFSLLC